MVWAIRQRTAVRQDRLMALYDTIGRTYAATRRPDPRVAAQILDALGDAESVVNIGAGTGSYEPAGTVLAVDPSRTMLAQRPREAAPAVQAAAEQLPLPDHCVDAAMAILTVHHWRDLAAGIAEMRRVARRAVLLTCVPEVLSQYWLFTEYFPEAAALDTALSISVEMLTDHLGGVEVRPVPIPYDCVDGFGAAYWRRPEAYLDPSVRAGISILARVGEPVLRAGLDRLAEDVRSRRWHERHADLLARETLDIGYCLVVAEW
jgi:SAM-dependent methyltransferase